MGVREWEMEAGYGEFIIPSYFRGLQDYNHGIGFDSDGF